MTIRESIELTTAALQQGQWPAVAHLLTASYPEQHSGELSPEQLLTLLPKHLPAPGQTLLESLQGATDNHRQLQADSFALIAFADQLFNNFQKNSKLHPTLLAHLDVFRACLLKSLCQQQLPWSDPHSAVRHLPIIIAASAGWQPELGRAADKYTQSLAPLLIQLAQTEATEQTAALATLEQFLNRDQQRVAKLEQRIRDAEMGQLQARHAKQLAAKTLNQQMAGKQLPLAISRFLQGPWHESMRLLLLSKGHDSQEWRKMLRLTETLVWSVQPIGTEAGDDKRQHIYQSISELSEELREFTVGLHHSSKLDEELSLVEAEHLNILKGAELNYAPFQLIDNADSLINSQVSVSSGLIKKVAQLEQGQWFLYHSDEGEKRLKLTIKLDQAQQLLFTNFLGIKAAQFNFEEFAYMLSSKIAIPLPSQSNQDLLTLLGEKMLTSLLQRYQQQQADLAKAKAEAAERQRQEEQAQEAARQKALEEAKAHARAAEQALQQARHEAALKQQQREQEQLHAALSSQLKTLQTGARISYRTDEGQTVPCRLAAVLQATGDYIFVNSSGVKQLAANREKLLALLAEDRVKIIDAGSNFESTLEQVVNNLRERKKP